MKLKFKLFILLGSLLNAVALVIASNILLNLAVTPEDEYLIIKFTSALKNIGLGLEEKPEQKDFLFVNVAYAKTLIPKYDESGIFPIGNEAVTDRGKLAQLFQNLKKHPDSYRYILCDIHFKGESEQDLQLATALDSLPSFIASYHFDPNTQTYENPIFNINKGLADYQEHKESFWKDSEGFLKYSLMINDSVKSLPLKMYLDIHGKPWKKTELFYYLDKKPVFNSFILNFRIRNHDLFESEKPYPSITLDDLLLMDPKTLADFVKGRIIVIGDFTDRDIHDTIYGKTAGSLILVNAYLALVYGDIYLQKGLIIALFLILSGLSYLALYPQKFLKNWLSKKLSLKAKWAKFLFDFMAYFVILAAVSIASFFIYNIHLNVFFLALEIHLLSRAALFFYKKKGIAVEENGETILNKA